MKNTLIISTVFIAIFLLNLPVVSAGQLYSWEDAINRSVRETSAPDQNKSSEVTAPKKSTTPKADAPKVDLYITSW